MRRLHVAASPILPISSRRVNSSVRAVAIPASISQVRGTPESEQRQHDRHYRHLAAGPRLRQAVLDAGEQTMSPSGDVGVMDAGWRSDHEVSKIGCTTRAPLFETQCCAVERKRHLSIAYEDDPRMEGNRSPSEVRRDRADGKPSEFQLGAFECNGSN